MKPAPSDLHVNRVLTNLSIAYTQGLNEFIADRVFPNVPVQNKSDVFWKYKREDWLRIEAQPRAPATETAGGGWEMETDTYSVKVYGIHKDIDDQTRANADSVFNMDRDATEYVTRQLLLKKEKLWVDTYFKAGVWGTDLVGVSGTPTSSQVQQFDQAASDPIRVFQDLQINMAKSTGYRPNTLVLGPAVRNALLNHPDFIDRVKYTQRGVITEDMLASLLGVERVLIPYVIYNTAGEGLPGSYQFMFDKHALLCYTAPNAGLMQVSAGYTFSWAGYVGAGPNGLRISRFRIDPIRSDRIEGEMAFQHQTIAPDLGVFMSDLVP